MYWERYSQKKINQLINEALNKNYNYKEEAILGIPGTYLDELEFYDDAPFLEHAPFLRTMIANPNHIGCHTLEKEALGIFAGTQAIEKEVIQICAEEIFQGEKDQQDGYVATGGTEANIQAMWIYRNYFQKEYGAKLDEINLVYSEDSHYSMPKGGNLLGIKSRVIKVNSDDRSYDMSDLENQLGEAKREGVKHFIVILNMSTTMFGSVDDIGAIGAYLKRESFSFKIHLDGAFGGFIYPFTNSDSKMNFKNDLLSSITVDGHKMLQSPYGTGIFLCRKGLMNYVQTEEAQYVPGLDSTLCGSRSGANAVAVWQILHRYGSEGWLAKMKGLWNTSNDLCELLDEMKIPYTRNEHLNIITMRSGYFSEELAHKYELVADSYEKGVSWCKIVIMPHVKQRFIDDFLSEVKLDPVYLQTL